MATLELEVSDLLVTEPDDLLGAVLEGYAVEERIGAGLMGDVYRCVATDGGAEVAIKVLRASWSANREAVARFQREARLAGAIEHPGVVRALGSGRLPDGRHFLITEFCRGINLRQALEARGRVPAPEALGLIRQVTLAVAAAHAAGVVHRDLKPENIMLLDQHPDHSVERCRVKLLDFGLARLSEQGNSPQLTAHHMVLGTPKYMAPEQVGGAAAADSRADLYSLGVVLYELVCGRPPFFGDTMEILRHHLHTAPVAPSRIAPDARIPTSVDALVLKLLAKDPAGRVASAMELARALDVISAPWQLSAAATGEFTALVAGMRELSDEPSDAPPEIEIDLDTDVIVEVTERQRVLRLFIEQKAQTLRGEDLFTVLGLGKGASSREIDGAYHHLVGLLSPASLAQQGLADLAIPSQRILARAGEARAILTDAGRRADYERSIAAPAEQARAEAHLNRALQADLEYEHGLRLIEQGKFAQAESLLSNAVGGNPEPQYRAAEAWARYNNPEHNRAAIREAVLLALLTAVRERPQLISAHRHIGQIFLEAGNPERALASFTRALKLDPADAEARQGAQKAGEQIRAR